MHTKEPSFGKRAFGGMGLQFLIGRVLTVQTYSIDEEARIEIVEQPQLTGLSIYTHRRSFATDPQYSASYGITDIEREQKFFPCRPILLERSGDTNLKPLADASVPIKIASPKKVTEPFRDQTDETVGTPRRLVFEAVTNQESGQPGIDSFSYLTRAFTLAMHVGLQPFSRLVQHWRNRFHIIGNAIQSERVGRQPETSVCPQVAKQVDNFWSGGVFKLLSRYVVQRRMVVHLDPVPPQKQEQGPARFTDSARDLADRSAVQMVHDVGSLFSGVGAHIEELHVKATQFAKNLDLSSRLLLDPARLTLTPPASPLPLAR